MINLYLVRPIRGSDYIIARWLAFLVVSLAVAWLPQFVLMMGGSWIIPTRSTISGITGRTLQKSSRPAHHRGAYPTFNLANIPVHMNDLIFGEVSDITGAAPASELPTWILVSWYLLWVLMPGGVLWARYRRLTP